MLIFQLNLSNSSIVQIAQRTYKEVPKATKQVVLVNKNKMVGK